MKLGEKPGSSPNQALHGDFEMLVMVDVIFTIWPGAKAVPLVVAVIRTAEGAQRGGFGLVVVVTVGVVAVAADGRTDVVTNPDSVTPATAMPKVRILPVRRLRERLIAPFPSVTGPTPAACTVPDPDPALQSPGPSLSALVRFPQRVPGKDEGQPA
jgi:hypothetical protein